MGLKNSRTSDLVFFFPESFDLECSTLACGGHITSLVGCCEDFEKLRLEERVTTMFMIVPATFSAPLRCSYPVRASGIVYHSSYVIAVPESQTFISATQAFASGRGSLTSGTTLLVVSSAGIRSSSQVGRRDRRRASGWGPAWHRQAQEFKVRT